MVINDKIKELREKSKITQESMSNYLNVTQSYISKIESSEREIPVELLVKIANLFVCDINDLIDDSKKISPIVLPFRKKNYSVEDLQNFGNANRIIMNFNEMIDLLEE
jgi:transcriptional regulator with XRE-family HTH domain